MGLCINAIDHIQTEIKKNGFFDKYDIPQKVREMENNDDIWDWLFGASNTSTAELKESNDEMDQLALKWRNALQKKMKSKPKYDPDEKRQKSGGEVSAEKVFHDFDGNCEVDYFNMGYVGFYCIREELAKACGGRYYRKSDGSALGELRFEYPLDWLKTREGQSALDFFFHSDCDGNFSEAQIHAFAKFLCDNHARINVKKHCTAEWKQDVLDFIDFVQTSSHGTIHWVFA